jgi:lysophospholipase L1-like esterase
MAVLGSVVAEIALTNRKEKQLGPRAELAGFHPYLQNVPVPSDRKMSINRWGFRGEEIDLAKPDGTYRIFVLGGSTVFCGEVDFEQTHCRLMEKKLRQAYPGVKIEVQNAGVPWHTSQHSLIKFLTKVEDFQPDLVIIYHGINDLCRGFSPPYASVGEYQPDYSHFYGPVATMVRTYAEDRGRFHLYVLDEAWTFLARQWFSDIRGTAESDPPVVVKPWNEWKSLPSFKRNLGNLALVLRAKQIELVMASQPYLLRDDLTAEERRKMKVVANLVRNQYEQPDVASIRSGMETFNRTAKAVADEYGAVFVDLEKCVPKAVDYFVDDFHYTPDGNRLVCEALTDAVIMNGFVDKKFPREK